jgi:hypothetical protein
MKNNRRNRKKYQYVDASNIDHIPCEHLGCSEKPRVSIQFLLITGYTHTPNAGQSFRKYRAFCFRHRQCQSWQGPNIWSKFTKISKADYVVAKVMLT